MNLRPSFSVLTVILLVAWIGAGCGPPLRLAHPFRFGPTAAGSQPELDSWSSNPRLGVKALTDAAIRVPAAAAEAEKVTLYLPAGYAINLAASPGTREGHDFLSTASDFYAGNLKVVNPAAYVNTPQAQACAPGAHPAVWTMHFEGSSSSTAITVPIFIDPTSGDETALGAYKLQACLPLAKIASPGGNPLGSRLRELGWEFTQLKNPNSKAVYAWRAFVSNPDAHGNPDPSTTYELRSDLPLPAKLTLTARADPTHHRAALDGRLTTYTLPVARVPIALYRRPSCGCWRYLTRTQTTTNGSYRFVLPIRKTSAYSAEAWEIGACSGDSTAPKGCIDETRAVIDSPTIRIVVRRRH